MESNGLCCKLRFIKSLRESGWRKIAKTGLLSLAVVEDLVIFDDALPSLDACRESAVMHKLVFQPSPEAFHWRVVHRVGLPAHGRGDADLAQRRLVVAASVLNAPVRVVNEPSP